MVSKRNRELIDYFESLGIEINIGKNKARGNQGIFVAKKGEKFRIDISREVDENNILSIMLHEFAHYVHYCYDSTLKSLDFVFEDISDTETEELLRITVEKIPKATAQILYDKKEEIAQSVKQLAAAIRSHYPEYSLAKPFKPIERSLHYPVKYLLRYDKIRYLNSFYSIENLHDDFPELSDCQRVYIALKSKQRALARINSRINRLNKYYNTPTELWARFCELFFTNPAKINKLAPQLSIKFRSCLNTNKIKELSELDKILHNIT